MKGRWWLVLLAALLVLPLEAGPFEDLQRRLEQNRRSPQSAPQQGVAELKSYLKQLPLEWREVFPRYGGLPTLIVKLPGSGGETTPVLFTARIRGALSDVLTLARLLTSWSLSPPAGDGVVAFLGEEDIFQPERTRFARQPFVNYAMKPYQASAQLLDSELDRLPKGVVYLRSGEQAWLNFGREETPFGWGKWVWTQLADRRLPLFGGMGKLSRVQSPPELGDVYAQRAVPLVVASLPARPVNNVRTLVKIAEYGADQPPSTFFYAFVLGRRLYSLNSATLLGALFILLGGWILLLSRRRRWSLPLLEWLHFAFTLLVISLCSLLIWVLISRVLFPQAEGLQLRTTALHLSSTFVVFHLLLFPLHRYSPRPLSCLLLCEGLLLVSVCALSVVEPLLAIAQLPILLLHSLLNSLPRNRSRRVLSLLHSLYVAGFYLFFLLGQPSKLLFSAYNGWSQLLLLIVWMPVFFLFLGSQKIARLRLPRVAWAQHWFNLLLFAFLTLTSYLSNRFSYQNQAKEVAVTYLMDWTSGGARAVVRSNTKLSSFLIYLGKKKLQGLEGKEQTVPVDVSLPAVQSRLTMRASHRRKYYRLELDYRTQIRTLQVRIPAPAGTMVTTHPRLFVDERSTILRVDSPQFPLVLEWSSEVEDAVSDVQLAATLADVPFVTIVASPGPLRIRKSCQLYWQLRSKTLIQT